MSGETNMNRNRPSMIIGTLLIGILSVSIGCEEPRKATSIDNTRYTNQFNRMVHNAELADMVVTDVHFLPNRAILTSTGTQRLAHLAWVVNNYGGTIYLDFEEPKSKLSSERKEVVRAYLAKLGLPKDKIKLTFGLPPIKGMDSAEAMEIYKNTRFKPEEKTSK